MVAAGVEPVVHASSIAVVGLVEVLEHIPRIYSEFRKLIRAAEQRRPRLAILTDSPDFNLRVAKHMKRLGIPVLYLVAPQVWAWRESRVKTMRRLIDHLLCIFPFEEQWFRDRGVNATYIGHPLTRIAKPSLGRFEFFAKHRLDPVRPLVVLLPGSRVGEVRRHLGVLTDAVRIVGKSTNSQFLLALPPGFRERAGQAFFRERVDAASIQLVEGETWDALSHTDLCLAASGTVTVEAAILGAPMVTFYRVSPLSWTLGRHLVRAPFLTMVNLVAGRKVVPELIQRDAMGYRLAHEALRLLSNPGARESMKRDLGVVASMLGCDEHPMDRAAGIALEMLG